MISIQREHIAKRIICFGFPLILYLSVIFYLSHQSNPTGSYDVAFNDKIVHAIEFAILGFLMLRCFLNVFVWQSIKRVFFLALFASVMYALLDELHQYFIPNREMSFLDFLADTVGVLLGTFLYSIIYKVQKK